MPADTTPALPRPLPHAVRRSLLALAACGLVLPWIWNIRYFLQGGSVMPQVFWPDAMANALTTAITVDVYLAATSFSVWVLWDQRVRRPWLLVLACFGLGLAFALPLYLALRGADRSAVSPATASPPPAASGG
jgi:Terpene cyclase DEP1